MNSGVKRADAVRNAQALRLLETASISSSDEEYRATMEQAN